MKLLDKHLSREIRFREEDLIVYEPKKRHIDKIKEILQKTLDVSNSLRVQGTVDVEVFRILIKDLTNIGDEVDSLTDDDIVELIEDKIENNGTRALKNLMQQLVLIIYEVIEDLQNEQFLMISNLNSIINSVEFAEKVESTITKKTKRGRKSKK